MYIKGYVETVDTKRSKQCYCVLSRVSCLSTLSIQRSKHAMHWMLCLSRTHPHIPAHNFLNIQRIFNPQKVLESWDSGLFNHTINTIHVDTVVTRQGSLIHSMLSMLTLSIQKYTHTFPAHNFLNIQWIFNLQKVLESWDLGLFNPYHQYYKCRHCRHKTRISNTLLIQFSHLIVLCIRCCVRATNTSVDSVDKHSIKCIVCFDLHIDSIDKQDTLLNTQ